MAIDMLDVLRQFTGGGFLCRYKIEFLLLFNVGPSRVKEWKDYCPAPGVVSPLKYCGALFQTSWLVFVLRISARSDEC